MVFSACTYFQGISILEIDQIMLKYYDEHFNNRSNFILVWRLNFFNFVYLVFQWIANLMKFLKKLFFNFAWKDSALINLLLGNFIKLQP